MSNLLLTIRSKLFTRRFLASLLLIFFVVAEFYYGFVYTAPQARAVITYFDSASNPADNGSLSSATTAVTPPANMLAGDLVIMLAENRNSGSTLAISETGGQTWTAEPTATGSTHSTTMFWARFNGTWTADPSVATYVITSGIPSTLTMHVFRPTNGANTWAEDVAEVQTGFAAPASPFDVTLTGITTNTNGAIVFATWLVKNTNTWTLQTAGWTVPGTAQYRNTSGSGQSNGSAYKVMATSGASGDVVNREDAGTNGHGKIIAFKEIAAAGGGAYQDQTPQNQGPSQNPRASQVPLTFSVQEAVPKASLQSQGCFLAYNTISN